MYSLPSSRTIDWTDAGVWFGGVKGIPSSTDVPVGITISTTPGGAYYCDPTGATNCQANLQAALTACTQGYAVYLPAGTYRIDTVVSIPIRRVLRGAGPGLTIVNSRGTYAFNILGSSQSYVAALTAADLTKGTYSVTTAASHTVTAGQLVIIDELNDSELGVTPIGTGGTCAWCGNTRDGGGARAMGQSFIVDSVAGNVITFKTPFYYTFKGTLSPGLLRYTNSPVYNSGIEELTIDCDYVNQSDCSGIQMTNCYWCWVYKVEIKNFNRKAIRTHTGANGCEVRKCYIHGAQNFSSDRGYTIHLFFFATDWLIEDNIFDRNHVGVDIESGGAGNVVGYNYAGSFYHTADPTFLRSAMSMHGAYPFMNLVEGNSLPKMAADNYWGNSGYGCYFRNHVRRTNPDWPTVSNDLVCTNLDTGSWYYSHVGNVFGVSGMTGLYEPNPQTSVSNYPVVFKRGYNCCVSTGAPVDLTVWTTNTRHGNYSYLEDDTRWEDGDDHDLADSMYLGSKPSWFGTLSWPPVGPDVGGYVNDIPAKWRWDKYQSLSDFNYLFTDDIGETTGYVNTFDARLVVSESETARLYVEYPYKRVVIGTSAVYTVHVEPYNSFVADVTLDTTGLPTNATDSYGTNPIAYTASTNVTIATTGVAAGIYSMYITGTAVGGEVGSARIIMEVVASDDCAPKLPVRRIRVKQGESAVFTVASDPTAGYTGNMDLSSSGVPSGATGTFADTEIAYNESTTFTVDSGTASVGEHEITITGEGPA